MGLVHYWLTFRRLEEIAGWLVDKNVVIGVHTNYKDQLPS